MSSFLIMIAVLLAAVIAIVLLAASRPDVFRVERSAHIKASPPQVFPHINDLRNWAAWSAWERMDPSMQKHYSADTVGTGACYEWQGNNKVGHGSMTITDSVAPGHLVIQLDFLQPFEAHNTAEFDLQAQDGGTRVTWSMYGPSPFISKLFGLFISMDQMVGKDFEDSLSNLKAVVEQQHP
jgi:uncharacterized protein YndB with AHSA1/START domain